jgi:hypothetical protein
MVTLANVVTSLQNVGIFEYYLPFVIMFAISYGILRKTQIFGKEEAKVINVIIALSISAFIMLYPATSGAVVSLSKFFASFFAGTLIIIVTILAFLMMMFIVVQGSGAKMEFRNVGKWAAIGIGILVFGTFIASGGFGAFPGLSNIRFNLQTPYIGALNIDQIAIIVIVFLTAVAIVWMTRGKDQAPAAGEHQH